MKKIYRALGLMSGTSLDGVDAAFIETDGEKVLARYGAITVPYKENFRNKIKDVIAKKASIGSVENELTKLHADAVFALLEKLKFHENDVDLIGFHGQTIEHRPDDGITVQIGDGEMLAKLTGIDVVNNFRINDVKNGGQGAPLVPIYHKAILNAEKMPVAMLNIGGVANVTWIGDEGIIAFDTGPGNAMLDDFILERTGKAHDTDGDISSKGKVREDIVADYLKHPYFAKKPPKSLDRNDFSINKVKDLSTEDGAITLISFTTSSVAEACRHFPDIPKKWFVAGGGRHNKTIMRLLAEKLGVVFDINELGFDGDGLEAEAFAFLAVRSVKGLPITFKSTTGVKIDGLSGGVFWAA